MVSITKCFEFEACHYLPNYNGKCANMHGHSYKLEVEVTGPILQNGMVLDFGELKKIVNDLVTNIFDHKNLNDYFTNPTAEIMVEAIAFELLKQVKVIRVRLWETSSSYAEWKVD